MGDKRFHKWLSKYMPRCINCMYAYLFAYFWLPCPMCGKKFGGHEWFNGSSIYLGNGQGEGVCPKCDEERKEEIRKISDERYKEESIISINGRKL